MEDISIGENKSIKWLAFDLEHGSYEIDSFIERTKDFWRFLEQDCVAGCCGIHAFVFWPEHILEAKEKFDPDQLKNELTQLKKVLLERPEKTIKSSFLNQLFDKGVFLQLIDHILFHL